MNTHEQQEFVSTDQYVIFKLDDESYGVSIHFVEIIEKTTEITRVPKSESFLLGVINLRGEIVPVIDLRKRFGLEAIPTNDESRIIILRVEEMIVGIMTDSSSEVLTISQDSIENAGIVMGNVDDTMIKGIGKVGNRMIMMIDVYTILGLRNREEQERGI